MDTTTTTDLATLRSRAQSGVGWFYWIAGLSLVNSIVAATGSQWGFMAGLGVTQLIDGMAQSVGSGAKPVALALDVLVAGMVVGVGVAASRNAGVYLAGMIAYALDAALFAVAGDWIGLGFHGLVLYFLWNGWSAQRELAKRNPEAQGTPEAEEARKAA